MTITTVSPREQVLMQEIADLRTERDELKMQLFEVKLRGKHEATKRVLAMREADRAAMRLAMAAMEYHVDQTRPIYATQEAITALRGRLETK